MELLQIQLHLIPVRNTLKSLLAKSPTPERQVGRGCFGQCSGQKGTGLSWAAAGACCWGLEGALGERRRGGGVGLLLLLSTQYAGASPFGYVFAKLEYVQKAEAEQVVGHSRSRTRRLKRMWKLVPRNLSSRSWVPAGRFPQILPEWLCGLSQGLSTLTSPTIRSFPGRVLSDGFESSGHPREDPVIVCCGGPSYPRPVSFWSSKSKSI